mmetsp:Transcript_28189/g.73889  ORF Transcript_28189/g.73889 Transcript_28189/m.73889 type:complete len:483 (+) Transcript_28189:271-1719(+)|eukprot:CAMPEP_0182940952 /NCGR_PEP_ID=MMETSP0105_2-20130417/48166_1 /TAXON_ID=81532 ORGANISM="Acanthoeca-like sp., Strain 10tr" /NCGR_SAMPLE_ID=MMETSP0105_2 /ASSEMBLY_ACC=CAM_ASM_000205 /LENGTH=482 /DNA_ID=CAMNT_0025080511 /DNA_START=188 /DNA_END=1636 /DNA_ORIENTATION=+
MADKIELSQKEEKVYAALWQKAPTTLDAGDAVELLQSSALDEDILHEIWELADSEEEGMLNFKSFKVAMKLVALAQAGHQASVANLGKATDVADLGQHTKSALKDIEATAAAAGAASAPAAPSGGDDVAWEISAEEKIKYDKCFDDLGPTDEDLLTGKKASKVLMKTNLPKDTLGKIWELADIDGDGSFDRDEFAVAMHLVKKFMNKEDVGDTLPPSLVPPSKRAPNAPSVAAAPTANVAQNDNDVADDEWIIKDSEFQKYNQFFAKADTEGTGKVSGGNIMKIFLTSKLPKETLAHVWNLVDIDDSGMINAEQFALAMHFIAMKVKGTDIPQKLTPIMVPPSLRPKRSGSVGHNAELAKAKKENENLRAEIAANEASIAQESGDLSAMQAEIKLVRAQEKELRQELKAGKDKLVELIAQKRKAKADKKKIDGKIGTLTASKAKVDAGLKSAGYEGGGAAATADPSEMETHGMSMADYFGQS